MVKFVRGFAYHCHDLVINMIVITHNVDVRCNGAALVVDWSLYLTLYVSHLMTPGLCYCWASYLIYIAQNKHLAYEKEYGYHYNLTKCKFYFILD